MNKYYVLIGMLIISGGAIAQELYTSPLWGEQGHREYTSWSGSGAGFDGVLLDNGKLLVAGTGYWNGCNCFRMTMAQLDTTCGALDPTFGTNGTAAVQFEGRSLCFDVDVQDNGKIVACGITAPGNGGSSHKSTVYRLMPDGTPDMTFNGSGYHKALWDPISSGSFWKTFSYDDGRITCVGASSSNINGGTNGVGVMRFTSLGQLDPTYSGDGIARLNLSGTGYTHERDIGTAVMLADSSTLAIGLFAQNNVKTIGMIRIDVDGNMDTNFGNNGLNVSPVIAHSQVDEGGMNAIIDPNGKILVSGTSDFTNGDWFVARFHDNGDVDSTYAVNGISVVNLGANSLGRRFELLPNGSTIQYGSANWNNGHARMVKRLSDGSLDMSFSGNGIAAPSTPLYKKLYGGMTLPSGKIIAWGHQGEISVFKFTTDPTESIVDLGQDFIGCGDSTMLDAGAGFTSYAWNTGDSAQTIYATSAGDHIVTVTDSDECSDSDTVYVALAPLPTQPVITSGDGILLETTANGDLQWYLDGVAITGATGQSHLADTNGDYTVEVTDLNGCANVSDPFEVLSVGIAESDITPWSVGPNPVMDRLFIYGPLSNASLEITVMSTEGRTVLQQKSMERVVNLGQLAPGAYILAIVSDEEDQFLRFIKR